VRPAIHCGACGRHIQEHGFECMFLIVLEAEPVATFDKWTSIGFTEADVRAQVRAACDAAGWERNAGDE
jgi:hypothetical protein